MSPSNKSKWAGATAIAVLFSLGLLWPRAPRSPELTWSKHSIDPLGIPLAPSIDDLFGVSFRVPDQTPVRILQEQSVGYGRVTEVEIVAGPSAGRTGWVFGDWVK